MTIRSLLRTPALYEFHESELRDIRRVFVVGDLHGDYASLALLLKIVNFTHDIVIFLGDYADRGPNSVGVVRKVYELINKFPHRVVALKGNHEDYSIIGEPLFSPCDFVNDVKGKGLEWHEFFEKELKPFLQQLYLSAIIPNVALFVHGGVSSKIGSRQDLCHPSRDIELDVLWSDPLPDGLEGEHKNLSRGLGVNFGYDIIGKICRIFGVKKIIRSHQPYKASEGSWFAHGGKLITINSSRIYGKVHVLVLSGPNFDKISTVFL